MPSRSRRQHLARELMPLLAWICGITVALAIRYGFYGDKWMVLGPYSSQMVTASSIFVEEIQMMDAKKGAMLYGFDSVPELSIDSNWSVSKHLYLDFYTHQGISLWLNKGSKIWMQWEVAHGGQGYEDILVVALKEENVMELDMLHRLLGGGASSNVSNGTKEAEYKIKDDDIYYIGILNLSPRNMVITLKINISSKLYDTSKATSICCTSNGICNLKLVFPNTRHFVLTTPNEDVTIMEWPVHFSFAPRLASYFVTVGCLVIVIYFILYYFKTCGSYGNVEVVALREAQPLLASTKEMSYTYKTNEEDLTSLSGSSEDLYDKICAICYDEPRDSFLTPCGHSISCYTCAQRIVKDNNACPICRRRIHKVRRLMISSR